MRTTIVDVSHQGRSILARFDTIIGSAWAVWNGSTAPQPGKTYDVEIDIEDQIDLSKNARIISDSHMAITGDKSHVTLAGVVEEQDGDGMAYLRIARDCLIMIEVFEGAFKGRCLEILVPTQAVGLSPFGSEEEP
jgi:hypothetical protein